MFCRLVPLVFLQVTVVVTAPAITVTVQPAVLTEGVFPPEIVKFIVPVAILTKTASFPVLPSEAA